MRLVTYSPQTVFKSLHDDINQLLSQHLLANDSEKSTVETSQWCPQVDVKETPEAFVFYADLPGVSLADVEISVEKNLLTIKGERKENKEESNENFVRVERFQGVFYRRFNLPDIADIEKISAKGKNGVLEIVIPKSEVQKSRKINVKIEE